MISLINMPGGSLRLKFWCRWLLNCWKSSVFIGSNWKQSTPNNRQWPRQRNSKLLNNRPPSYCALLSSICYTDQSFLIQARENTQMWPRPRAMVSSLRCGFQIFLDVTTFGLIWVMGVVSCQTPGANTGSRIKNLFTIGHKKCYGLSLKIY